MSDEEEKNILTKHKEIFFQYYIKNFYVIKNLKVSLLFFIFLFKIKKSIKISNTLLNVSYFC